MLPFPARARESAREFLFEIVRHFAFQFHVREYPEPEPPARAKHVRARRVRPEIIRKRSDIHTIKFLRAHSGHEAQHQSRHRQRSLHDPLPCSNARKKQLPRESRGWLTRRVKSRLHPDGCLPNPQSCRSCTSSSTVLALLQPPPLPSTSAVVDIPFSAVPLRSTRAQPPDHHVIPRAASHLSSLAISQSPVALA